MNEHAQRGPAVISAKAARDGGATHLTDRKLKNMNRCVRALVAATAALALVGVAAPATMAGSPAAATSTKVGQGDKKHEKRATGKKSKSKKVRAAKELAAKKSSAASLVASRDTQLAKLPKYLADYEFSVIGGVDAMAALQAHIAADRAVLAAISNRAETAKSTAQLVKVIAPLAGMRVENYKAAADLLEWADENAWYVEDENDVAPILALIDAAVARLLTVTAFAGKAALSAAENFLSESDDLIDQLDGSADDELEDDDADDFDDADDADA